MNKELFTTAEVVHITQFTERQLNYWDQQGILKPGGRQASGSGSRRLYTLDDLVQLRVMRMLKQHGWSTQKIREAITRLREVMGNPDPLKSAVLVDGKGTILALCKTKQGERVLLDALSSGGQLVMGIVLEMLLEDARQITTGVDQFKQEKVGNVAR